jgi:hypothetical protein
MSEPQGKEYFEKRPGFVVKSGTKDAGKSKIDYAVFTDCGQGFEYNQDGRKVDVCRGTSLEICGIDVKDGEFGKIIDARSGDILIEALDGDIILRAKNIRIVALDGSGEVTINAGKHIHTNAPITSIKGSISNTVMTNSASTGALSTDTTGIMQNSQSSGAEEGEGSFLTKLLSIAKKFQKFLE